MLLTEEEAKTKFCPYQQAQWEDPTQPCCIASECMAWRQGVYEHQRNLAPEDRTTGVGYCGLAGRP